MLIYFKMSFIPVMAKLNFQPNYCLQCHMILLKSFKYSDLLLKKHYLFVIFMKAVVLLNIFVATTVYSIFLGLFKKIQKHSIYL